MGNVIGSLRANSTDGERRVYQFLEEMFEADDATWCYYEPLLGDARPDFIVLAPTRGVILIEVKDYAEGSIAAAPPTTPWTTTDGKVWPNPLHQIYQYWTTAQNRITYLGLDQRVPVHQVVILTNIRAESPVGTMVKEVRQARVNLITQEGMVSRRTFAAELQAAAPEGIQLTQEQMKVIRYNLTPEGRVPTLEQVRLDQVVRDSERLLLLDRDQETLAKNLGDGHRIFFGVAGSGKTVLLVARARYLASMNPDWRILILVYNVNLANWLQMLLNPQEFHAEITVLNFHKWARDVITANPMFRGLYLEEEQRHKNDMNNFFDEVVPTLLEQALQTAKPQLYDAILIDEAQDWQKTWFLNVVSLLNPITKSLLIACDGVQGIYKRKKFWWKEVGVEATGKRTKRLKKTYRNPRRIGEIAYAILPQEIKDKMNEEEAFVPTEEFTRPGGEVSFQHFNTPQEEMQWILDQVRGMQTRPESGTILVLFLKKIEKMREENNPFMPILNANHDVWVEMDAWGSGQQKAFCSALPGMKGLEADCVFLPELDHYFNSVKGRQWLYVGMTRAIHKLVLTASRHTPLTREIEQLVNNRPPA